MLSDKQQLAAANAQIAGLQQQVQDLTAALTRAQRAASVAAPLMAAATPADGTDMDSYNAALGAITQAAANRNPGGNPRRRVIP